MKKIACIYFIIISAVCFTIYNLVSTIHKEKIPNQTPPAIEKQYDVLNYKDRELCENISKKNNIPLDLVIGAAYLSHAEGETILTYENIPKDLELFKKYIQLAKSANLLVYNNRTNKYHHITCRYGLVSDSIKIIPCKEVPETATPCKLCFQTKQTANKPSIITPSLVFSGDRIKVLLSDYTTNLKPSKECRSYICKELVAQINNAQNTIDMAVYGYNNVPAIEFALSNAIKRGVKIRLVYDIDLKGENIYPDTTYLAQLIPNSRCDQGDETAKLMHNKFFIFDSKTVMTGSANLAPHDMSGYGGNSAIIIYSPEVAQLYEKEFNQMYDSKYHSIKISIPDCRNFTVGDSTVSVYFSPKDNAVSNGLIPLINSAKKYIYIPTFLITERDITAALIEARQRGVEIKVIVDALNARNKSSKHQLLRDNGVLVKTENYAGKLHSKSMIVDDEYVVIGSMNFSYSGNTKNDENMVILRNSQAAIFYKKFFEYLWAKIPDYWLTHNVAAEGKYSIGSCSDGVDNDYDGKIDMADEGCFSK